MERVPVVKAILEIAVRKSCEKVSCNQKDTLHRIVSIFRRVGIFFIASLIWLISIQNLLPCRLDE